MVVRFRLAEASELRHLKGRLEDQSPRSQKMTKRVARRPGKPNPSVARSLGRLPEWNLNDLYTGLGDPAIKRDLDLADADCVAFEEAFKGKLATMAAASDGGVQLAEAVRRYEAI